MGDTMTNTISLRRQAKGGALETVTIPVSVKVSLGYKSSVNHDGKSVRAWARGIDGKLYTTNSRGGAWREARAHEQPPKGL
jgi:hypothetical protein